MKRPSNLILGFILAVAGILVAYGLGRMFFQVIQPTEVELEEDYNNKIN